MEAYHTSNHVHHSPCITSTRLAPCSVMRRVTPHYRRSTRPSLGWSRTVRSTSEDARWSRRRTDQGHRLEPDHRREGSVTLGPRRSSLSTATRRVLADEVVDAIRTAIVTGAIEAGDAPHRR